MTAQPILKSGRLIDRPSAIAGEREWVVVCTDGTEYISTFRSVKQSEFFSYTEVTNDCGTFPSVREAICAIAEKHQVYIR